MNAYFALNIPRINIDPDVNAIGLTLMGLGIAVLVVFLTWRLLPFFASQYRSNKEVKDTANNSIWFDYKESVLHCGQNSMRIEPTSLEYFVCEITFIAPSKYHEDTDIFFAKDNTGASETNRGVEQAVRRLNKKGKELGLKNNLFKRTKESTSVNDEYRQRIVND